jgi:hypothetical protein
MPVGEWQMRIARQRIVLSATLTIISVLLAVILFTDFGLTIIEAILFKTTLMLLTNTILVTVAVFKLNPDILASANGRNPLWNSSSHFYPENSEH